MANPSTKKGYFPLAIELAKQFAKHNIPGEEMRIIWAVWLKTWAWKKGNRRKDSDWISYSQLSEMTGIKRSNCVRSVKSLLSKRILVKLGNHLKFNQNYENWVLSKRIPLVSKRITPVLQKEYRGVLQKDTHKIDIKETITKETSEAVPHKAKFNLEKYPKSEYVKITEAYKRIKNIEPKGDEWLPILKEIKLMFKVTRTAEQIIETMEICEDNYSDWSMSTVRMKIADVVGGKLKSKNTTKSQGIVVKGVKDI